MRKNISSALAGFLAALLLWCLLPVTAEAAGASFSGSGSVRAGDSVTVTFSAAIFEAASAGHFTSATAYAGEMLLASPPSKRVRI